MRVELFGFPRVLAGQATLSVEPGGDRLRDVASALGGVCPALRGSVVAQDGWLVSGYVFAVDGRFTRDPDSEVAPDAEVLLVASAAGG